MIKNIIVKLSFCFLIFFNSIVLTGEIPSTERAALIALYNSTNGNSWIDNSGWKTPPLHSDGFALPGSESKWAGVKVDGNVSFENVVEIFLPGKNLRGSIPGELGNLTHLEGLYLQANSLIGNIPPELGNLSNLVSLNLGYNKLTGSIPTNLGNLANLSDLFLGTNDLSGSIPPQLGNLSHLRYLCLSHNKLSGNIPVEIGNLGNLVELILNSNLLTGNIPAEIAKISHLNHIFLENNMLSGNIPSELGNLSYLMTLHLENNQLTGNIPSELGKLGYLYYLILDNNKLNGTIPSELGKLTKLITLNVAHNQLSGNIPWVLGNLISIKFIYMQDNLLDGNIPQGLAKLDNLENLNLSENQLSGSIPSVWGNLNKLRGLYLNSNKLSGTIPAQLGNFFNLSYLYLNNNTLSGEIPSGLKNLREIIGLGIGHNCLSATDTGLINWLNTHEPGWEVNQNECKEIPAKIHLDHSHLNFGIGVPVFTIYPQQVMITNEGGGTLNWSTTCSASWISVKPSSGKGDAILLISINPEGLTKGNYMGTILVTDPSASNSPRTIDVSLHVYNQGETTAPFGEISTPVDGATLYGSIPVTGWVLDDLGVESVKIYNEDSYIGDAVFVDGARPDVEEFYPDYPNNYKAGWGYMLLSNCLPDGGNGTYTLTAKATDMEGHVSILGSKTITLDNVHSVMPYGALDTPKENGTAWGKEYVNYGWVVTPHPNRIPEDGSTINVVIDGVVHGNPVYNIYRPDIGALFPGLANSNGAGGYYYMNTLKLKNGIHTISWTAIDSGGNEQGIGSRYFTVFNSNAESANSGIEIRDLSPIESERISNLDINRKTEPKNKKMVSRYEIKELERLELKLNEFLGEMDGGFLLVGEEVRELPVGTTLDKEKGMFYWLPGVGFVGEYEFLFLGKDKQGNSIEKRIIISVVPKR